MNSVLSMIPLDHVARVRSVGRAARLVQIGAVLGCLTFALVGTGCAAVAEGEDVEQSEQGVSEGQSDDDAAAARRDGYARSATELKPGQTVSGPVPDPWQNRMGPVPDPWTAKR